MEYYYLGTESWWCGNWNHLVCRRSKCEVDHPSQSTVVNLGRKQKWCSLWSQIQQDTSGQDNFRILGCLWTIHHRCTCKWDWTEMLNVSFPLRAKTVWNLLRLNTEICRRARIQWCQLWIDDLRLPQPVDYLSNYHESMQELLQYRIAFTCQIKYRSRFKPEVQTFGKWSSPKWDGLAIQRSDYPWRLFTPPQMFSEYLSELVKR